MNFRIFNRFLLTTTIIGHIWSFPLGCYYNETVYKEGEIINTNEPCLLCVCRRGSLLCNLLVCIDPPETLPPGCFAVHNANECCPQVFCHDSYRQNIIEVRTAFKSQNKTERNGCIMNGNTYAEGSAMATSISCEYCYCTGGEMKCVKPHCSLHFEGCRPLQEKSSCCPTFYDCRDAKVDISAILEKNFVKASSKILNNMLQFLSNETMEKKVVNVPKDPTKKGEVSGYSYQTEGKIIESEPSDFTLTSKEKLNAKKEHLEKNMKNIENSTSPGVFPSIYPSVVTEAVIESHDIVKSEKREQISLKTSGIHTCLYTNNYVPSVKTEGVFQPKKSPTLGSTSIEKSDFKNDLVFRPPVSFEDSKLVSQFISRPEFKTDSEYSEVLNNKQFVVGSAANISNDLYTTYNAFDKAKPVSVMSLVEDLTSFHSSHQQREKPLTVMYKNIIVDYYPEYLVTFSRDSFKIKTDKNSINEIHQKDLMVFNSTFSTSSLPWSVKQNLNSLSENIQTKAIINDSSSASFSDFTGIQKTLTPLVAETLIDTTTVKFSEIPLKHFSFSISTATEPFFFNGFLKKLLEERKKPAMSRHKYSSKTTSTSKPGARGALEKATIPSNVNNTKFASVKKGKSKEIIKSTINVSHTVRSPSEENKNIQLLQTKRNSEDGTEGRIQTETIESNSFDFSYKNESSKQIKSNVENFLKLAGCNIYGRIYRVGKIIAELAEPCSECICTDLGVQCISLPC